MRFEAHVNMDDITKKHETWNSLIKKKIVPIYWIITIKNAAITLNNQKYSRPTYDAILLLSYISPEVAYYF